MTIYDEKYWTQDVKEIALKFFQDPKINRLFFWAEEEGLRYTFMEPPLLSFENSYDTEFIFFIKTNPGITNY